VPLAQPPVAAQAGDVVTDGWSAMTWNHLGDPGKGQVSAESWVDLDWPCLTPRDVDQNCDIQRVRGHGLARKVRKVARVEIGLVRLGRHPAGTLVENQTNRNSGTRSQVEQTTPWVAATNEGCTTAFRTWTRTSFAVRWSDARLSRLSHLGDPTTAQLCTHTAAMTPAQRSLLRAHLPR
jgi:hypothetical protein